MKSLRSKRSAANNASFISNHDLLQNFRNKSFKLITRQSSVCNFKDNNSKNKVTLIKKKSYQTKQLQIQSGHNTSKYKQNKQNNQNLSNLNIHNNNFIQQEGFINKKGSKAFKTHHQILIKKQKRQNPSNRNNDSTQANKRLIKVLKQLNFVYDGINTDQVELKIILNKNIRTIKQLFQDTYNQMINKQSQQTINDLNNQKNQTTQKLQRAQGKIQKQSKQIYKIKQEMNKLREQKQMYQYRTQKLQQQLAKSKQQLVKCKQQLVKNKQQLVKSKQQLFKSKQNMQNQQTGSILLNNLSIAEKSYQKNGKQGGLLQKIIVNQSQLINQQYKQFEQQSYNFYHILKTQANLIQKISYNGQNYIYNTKNSMNQIQKQKNNIQTLLNPYRIKDNKISSKQTQNNFRYQNQKANKKLLTNNKQINSKRHKQSGRDYSICLY